jgi:hypothetical protein
MVEGYRNLDGLAEELFMDGGGEKCGGSLIFDRITAVTMTLFVLTIVT